MQVILNGRLSVHEKSVAKSRWSFKPVVLLYYNTDETLSHEAIRDARLHHRNICFAWLDLKKMRSAV